MSFKGVGGQDVVYFYQELNGYGPRQLRLIYQFLSRYFRTKKIINLEHWYLVASVLKKTPNNDKLRTGQNNDRLRTGLFLI